MATASAGSSYVISQGVSASGADGPAKVAFLWNLSEKFEKEGNVSESVKSAQTALLLQHTLLGGGEAGGASNIDPVQLSSLERQFDQPLFKAAQNLVLKCNAQGVDHFQRDQYDVASFLLDRALFLTNDTPSTNCFQGHDHDRLRLRAATYNNLGCLEKRRNNFEHALELLQKAVEVESLVDSDLGPSASTNLNLCTVLNKLRRHHQATTAAERAVQALKFHMQQGHENLPHFAQMLAMAYYNLGVSLEFSGSAQSQTRALDAYRAVIDSTNRYMERGQGSNLMEVAAQAIERIEQTTAETPTLPPIGSRDARTAPSASTGRHLALPVKGSKQQGQLTTLSGETPTSSSYTPRPPSQTSQVRAPSMTNRGFGANTSTLEQSGNKSTRLDAAVAKHAERIMTRQKRQAAMRERDQIALRKAQQAHVKEKEKKLRKEKELEEQRREEMRDQLFDKMVAGLRAEQVREIKNAARMIQANWRGWLTRDYMRNLAKHTIKIQAWTRSCLCRKHLKEANEKAMMEKMAAIQRKKEIDAAVKIQRRVRKFLRRCAYLRDLKCRKIQMNACARIIQRFYRDHRARVQQRIIDKLEAERQADQERQLRLHKAACKIQGMYRAFKSRRFLRVVKQEQARRANAARKVQALMRGALTRTWFRHYRLYRRQQELSTAKNLAAIRKIQRAWRMALAKMIRRRLENERAYKNHQNKVQKAALRIQCAWRCSVARHRAGGLRRIQRRKVAAATKIQGRWRVYCCRKEYLFRIKEVRLLRALMEIQRWGRAMQVRKRHMETAMYHAKLLKDEQIAMIKTKCAIDIQCYARAWFANWMQEFRRIRHNKVTAAIMMVQAAGRHYRAQKEMATVQRITYLVHRQAEHEELCRVSATRIQTNTRGFLARKRAEHLKRQRIVVVSIQCAWRQYLARKELKRRQGIRRAALEDKAARKIQKSVRLFLKRQELKRLDAYYTERQRQKLLQQRREEAAICIQSQWKGYATRKAVGAERSRLLQNTVDAIRIQRAWRTCRFRRSINAEVKRRVDRKTLRDRSARKIQAVWRGVLAREFVSLLREKRYTDTVAVIVMQCAWRSYRSRMERKIRKTRRQYEQRISAEQHDRCVNTANMVTSWMKTIVDQRRKLKKMEQSIAAELEDRRRWRAKHLFVSATRIQAWYRGCYERVYVRGLKAEKAERDRVAAEKKAKEEKAAGTIQRGYRCSKAREEAQKRRFDKNLKAQEEQLERERTAQPTDIIKSIFWAHEASANRDYTKEQADRHGQQDNAAIQIQKTARMFVAVRRHRRRLAELKEKRAAEAIQGVWRKHDQENQVEKQEKRVKAAIKIQSVARMYLVRRTWSSKKETLAKSRGLTVSDEEKRDAAATQIQAMWRSVCAQRYADGIRTERAEAKEAQKQDEAARLIQKHFRRYSAQKRVAKMKADRKAQGASSTASASTLQPTKPEGQPAPPPRRRFSTSVGQK